MPAVAPAGSGQPLPHSAERHAVANGHGADAHALIGQQRCVKLAQRDGRLVLHLCVVKAGGKHLRCETAIQTARLLGHLPPSAQGADHTQLPHNHAQRTSSSATLPYHSTLSTAMSPPRRTRRRHRSK